MSIRIASFYNSDPTNGILFRLLLLMILILLLIFSASKEKSMIMSRSSNPFETRAIAFARC